MYTKIIANTDVEEVNKLSNIMQAAQRAIPEHAELYTYTMNLGERKVDLQRAEQGNTLSAYLLYVKGDSPLGMLERIYTQLQACRYV